MILRAWMLTVVAILAVAALLFTLGAALGKVPLWVPVLLLAIIAWVPVLLLAIIACIGSLPLK